MKRNTIVVAVASMLGGALVSLGGYVLGTAHATVPVAPNRLVYSGQLTSGSGLRTDAPVVQVEFFSAATGGTSGGAGSLCGPVQGGAFPNGQFQIDVSSQCDGAFKSASSIFVQLTLNPTSGSPTLIPAAGSPRPKVSANPYTVQAETVPFAGTSGVGVTGIAPGAAGTAWPGSIPFANVTGTNVAWPGTIPFTSISPGFPAQGPANTKMVVATAELDGTKTGAAAIISQTGSWITQAAHTGTGSLTLTVANGLFKQHPRCVASVQDFGIGPVFLFTTLLSDFSQLNPTIEIEQGELTGNPTNLTGTDCASMSLICIGESP